MKKNYVVIFLTVVTVFICALNFALIRNNNLMVINNLLTLEALGNNEGTTDSEQGSIVCPPKKCDGGGCGSISCTITYTDVMGISASKTVEVEAGYFACCYEDFFGNVFAKSYSKDCCNGSTHY